MILVPFFQSMTTAAKPYDPLDGYNDLYDEWEDDRHSKKMPSPNALKGQMRKFLAV